MYVSGLLCLLKHIHDLIICRVSCVFSRFHKIFRHISYRYAPVVFNITSTFTSNPLLPSAGTYIQSILVIFVEPVRKLLIGNGFTLSVDGLLDRYNMHTKSAAALRHHVSDLADRYHGGIVEERSDLRMLLHQLPGHQHILTGTDYPFGNKITFLVFRVLTIIFKKTLPADALGHLCRLFDGHLISFSKLGSVKLDSPLLFEVEHEFDLFCCKQLVKQPEVGLIIADFIWLSRHAKIIRNERSELPDQLLTLFVFHLIGFRQIVPVIKKIVLKSFGYHFLSSLRIFLIHYTHFCDFCQHIRH